jgi:hypothetical protein
MLRAVLTLGSPSRAQDCTATAQNSLVIGQAKQPGCSGPETEMDFGEVKIRR